MRDMGADGYAPESRSKAFRLPKQALKWAVAQDPTSKEPLRLPQAAQAREGADKRPLARGAHAHAAPRHGG